MTAQTSNQLKLVSAEYLPELDRASAVDRAILNARIHFIYFVTVQKEDALEKGWQRFRKAEEQLPKLQAVVASSNTLASLRPEVDQLRRDFDSYKPVLERIIAVVEQKQNQGPEFAALLNEWARLGGGMVDSAGRLSRRGAQATDESTKQASSDRATITLAAACVAGLLIGVALTFFVTRDIARGLRKVSQDLGGAAEQVAGAASQIATSAQALSDGASKQAASLEETSASSEEINSMSRSNAQSSNAAAGNMVEAAQRVNEANRNLEQMMSSMSEMNASSQKISKIIKVIDEIAFQTNILALNAAVEAARAGEAGMGFAVVADEVRNLAQRCAQAAKDTAGLIEESIARSGEGSSRLGEVTEAIVAITGSSEQVKTLVDEVNLGSQEQARGIDQVAKAVSQMEQVTQKTAANAEESASAGEELSAQSAALRQLVDRLTDLVGGGESDAHVRRVGAQKTHIAARQSVPVARATEFPLEGDDFRE